VVADAVELLDSVIDMDGPQTPSTDDVAELDRRWAAIEAGEATVSNDDVVRWLRTWGSPTFKSWHDR
jgi:putative addiction module component